MNPIDAQSPLNQEKIRQRREEAARLQQIQIKQQAVKIEQQRQLAAQQKKTVDPTGPAQTKPEVVRPAFAPPPQPAPAKPVVAKAALAPPRAPTPVPEIAPS